MPVKERCHLISDVYGAVPPVTVPATAVTISPTPVPPLIVVAVSSDN